MLQFIHLTYTYVQQEDVLDKRLILLKLVLDGLNVGFSIATKTERLVIQKAIYLAQAKSHIDLGYRYGWYINGPYCKALADDYFQLRDQLYFEPSACDGKSLTDEGVNELHSVLGLLEVPSELSGLERPKWLELLASYDFLKRVYKKDENEISKIFQDASSKKELIPYLECANEVLAPT